MFRDAPLILLLLLAATLPQAHAAERCLGTVDATPAYTVDVVPQRGVLDTFRSWSQLLQRLGTDSGLCFHLHISDNFPDFEHALLAGLPDFIYMNPYHEVMGHQAAGYIPLIRDGAYELKGVLVVRRDSPVQEPHELDGRTIAFPAPNAYAASLLLRSYLGKLGIHFTPKYVGSHSNAYRAVMLGDVDAAGGVNTTFDRESAALRQDLRILYETPPSMPHPLAAHPRVPPEAREAVIAAMLRMRQDPSAQPLLDAVQIPQPVRANYTRDYGPIEALGLEHLVQHQRD